MTFLLGRHAILGREPPIHFRSITTAFFPFLAKVQATYLPGSPLPSTTRSYSSSFEVGVFMKVSLAVRRLVILFQQSKRVVNHHFFLNSNRFAREEKPL